MSLFAQLYAVSAATAYMDRTCISDVTYCQDKRVFFDDRNFLLPLQISSRIVEQLSFLFVKSWVIFDPSIVAFSIYFPSRKGVVWSLHMTCLLRASLKGEISLNVSFQTSCAMIPPSSYQWVNFLWICYLIWRIRKMISLLFLWGNWYLEANRSYPSLNIQIHCYNTSFVLSEKPPLFQTLNA